MPASSSEGLSGSILSAALDSAILRNKSTNSNFTKPAHDSDSDDDITESWEEGLITNELVVQEQEYIPQTGGHFRQKCVVSNMTALTASSNNSLMSGTTDGASLKHHKVAGMVANNSAKREDQMEEPRTVLYPKEKVKLGWHNPPKFRAGLTNLGNTCYLNSSLQALFHIPCFVNWLREAASEGHIQACAQQNFNQSYCSLCAMIKTYRSTTEPTSGAVRPHLIVNKLKCIGKMFVNGRQEDAHEFIKLLLDHMEKSYLLFKRATKLDHLSKQTTPLNQIFGGYLRQHVSCPSCHYVSTTFSHFQDLVLDIRGSNSIDQALDYFFRKETLDIDNCYKCERCKKKVPATKKYFIEKPPNALLIQLKRFTFSGCKISKHVNFQQYLDLSRFVMGHQGKKSSMGGSGMPQYKYKLVSMVVHFGGSQHGGHYTAFAEGANGHMSEFDDSLVHNVGLNTVLMCNPYILFYELMEGKSPNINVIKNHVPKQNGVEKPNGNLFQKNGNLMRMNGNNNHSVLKQNGHKFDGSNGSHDNKITNGCSTKENRVLTNGATEDLGQVVNSNGSLPPSKQREKITFDLKVSSKKSDMNVKRSTPKIVLAQGTTSLLSSAPQISNRPANFTSSPSTSNGTTTKNISFQVKKMSTSQAITEIKKKAQQKSSLHLSNGGAHTSLVPYGDDDSDNGSDCEGVKSKQTNGTYNGNTSSHHNGSSNTLTKPKNVWIEVDVDSTANDKVNNTQTKTSHSTLNGWLVTEKCDEDNIEKYSATNGFSVGSDGLHQGSNTSVYNNENGNASNNSYSDNDSTEHEQKGVSKTVNGSKVLSDESASPGQQVGVPTRVAPVLNKISWDKHSRGDLKYSLSSYKEKRTLNGEDFVARDEDGSKMTYRPVAKPIWTAADEDARVHGSEVKDARNFCFKNKISTWDDGESQLDAMKRQDIKNNYRKTEEEKYNEEADISTKKRKKFSYSDQQSYMKKKMKFDDHIKGRSENSNPNYLPLGNSSGNNNRQHFNNKYSGGNKYNDRMNNSFNGGGGKQSWRGGDGGFNRGGRGGGFNNRRHSFAGWGGRGRGGGGGNKPWRKHKNGGGGYRGPRN